MMICIRGTFVCWLILTFCCVAVAQSPQSGAANPPQSDTAREQEVRQLRLQMQQLRQTQKELRKKPH
jgi:hypothetical protein